MIKTKNRLAVVLCLVLIVTLLAGGCERNQNKKLRICFDVGHIFDMEHGTSKQQTYVESFLRCLTEDAKQGGISPDDVQIEIIPSDESLTTERSAVLQRIRTEIMTGGGPDVFVCVCDLELMYRVQDERLFPYVEKAVEDNFFLPLDGYLEDFTYSAWSEMNRHIMDGGKDREGRQVLLPMTYTLPMLSYYQDDVQPRDFTGTTWDDVLAGKDLVLAEQVRWFWSLADCWDTTSRGDGHKTGIALIYPELINTETGAIAFTEEELLNRVKKGMSAHRRLVQREPQAVSLNAISFYDNSGEAFLHMTTKDLTLIPLRNQYGGTTALASSYCAVNRNTKQVDKAVAAVDILLSEGMWLNSTWLTAYNYPVNQRVLIERNTNTGPYSFFTSTNLTENSFQEFLKAVDQVNAVRIPSRLDYVLDDMMREIQGAIGASYADPADDLYALRGAFILGNISDEELAEIVHKYYAKLCRLVDES